LKDQKPWITRPPAKNEAPQSGLRPGHPFGVPPPSAAPPPHEWMAYGHDCFWSAARRAGRHRHHSQNRQQCGTKAAGQPKPTTKARRHHRLACGQIAERSAALAAHGSSKARGKAWSKRPDRQAGRHGRKRPPLRGAKTGTNHARPTSRPPAQPGACARHAGKVCGDRKTEKPVYQEEGRPAPRIKRATAARRGRKARFWWSRHSEGPSKAEKRLYGRLVKSAGFDALNLSCTIKKSSGFQRSRPIWRGAPLPPAPRQRGERVALCRQGCRRRGASLPWLHPRLEAWAVPPASRVKASPAILTRSVLALRAALRMRPPVSPLTLLPLENRGGQRRPGRNSHFLCGVVVIVVV